MIYIRVRVIEICCSDLSQRYGTWIVIPLMATRLTCPILSAILRNDDVVIIPKRRHFDVTTSKWRRFDVIATLSLRQVFSGYRTDLIHSTPWGHLGDLQTDPTWSEQRGDHCCSGTVPVRYLHTSVGDEETSPCDLKGRFAVNHRYYYVSRWEYLTYKHTQTHTYLYVCILI